LSLYYTYDRPKTNLDINLQYHPSLSDPGRQRVQLDAGVKREFWKDMFVAVNLTSGWVRGDSSGISSWVFTQAQGEDWPDGPRYFGWPPSGGVKRAASHANLQ
jgi:hypothetical protein